MKEAYISLTKGKYSGYITNIKKELKVNQPNVPKITINMWIEAKTDDKLFLPQVGEV